MNILDKLSFANVSFVVLLGNALVSKDWVSFALVVVALALLINEKSSKSESKKEELATLAEKVNGIAQHLDLLHSRQDKLTTSMESVGKLAAEAKKMMSEMQIASAFVPRNRRKDPSL